MEKKGYPEVDIEKLELSTKYFDNLESIVTSQMLLRKLPNTKRKAELQTELLDQVIELTKDLTRMVATTDTTLKMMLKLHGPIALTQEAIDAVEDMQITDKEDVVSVRDV